MTDEQALVERLRAARWPMKIEGGRLTAWTATTDLCTEAADALVAQEARARKLETALEELLHQLDTDDVGGLVEGAMDGARAALAEGRGK